MIIKANKDLEVMTKEELIECFEKGLAELLKADEYQIIEEFKPKGIRLGKNIELRLKEDVE